MKDKGKKGRKKLVSIENIEKKIYRDLHLHMR
jgi:hypothetical protein